MKLATVLIDGRRTFGVVADSGFIDLHAALEGRFLDLREFMRGGEMELALSLADSWPATPIEDVSFLPPIPNPDARMFSLGWSYKDHQIETGKEAPAHPFLFSKHPQSMVGHGAALIRPKVSERFDFEGEIVVVIGKGGRHIRQEEAAAHIGGYAIGMDGSVRDWQQHSVTAGKNFDASSAYGPWIVTPDEVPNPAAMELTTRLNGEVMQKSGFGQLAWSVAELIAYVSSFTKLDVGDAISTGTPGGVGHKRTPPVFMKPGDVLEIEVGGIGVLRNPVLDE